MWQTRIICAGKLKPGPYTHLQSSYLNRIMPTPSLVEIDSRQKSCSQINKEISKEIFTQNPLCILDERGTDMNSTQFSSLLGKLSSVRSMPLQFVIGPADGLSPDIRSKGDKIIRFGAMTWPHILARIMLLEQIYRAQTIASGHPYHRAN